MIAFWRAAGPQKWFGQDAGFDREIVARFLPAHEAAAAGRLSDWAATPVTSTVPLSGSPAAVTRPSALSDQVPPDLDALCMELLQRDPAARPDGTAVLARLEGERPSASTLSRSAWSNRSTSATARPGVPATWR